MGELKTSEFSQRDWQLDFKFELSFYTGSWIVKTL